MVALLVLRTDVHSPTAQREPPAALIDYRIRGQLQTKSLGPSVDYADNGDTKVHGRRITPTNAASTTTETGWFPSQHAVSLDLGPTEAKKKVGVSTTPTRVIYTPTLNGMGNCGSTVSAKSDRQHCTGNIVSARRVSSYSNTTMYT